MLKTRITRSDYLKLALLTFGITLIALLPNLIANNGNLYLIGDHMTQQIPFIRESRRMFLSGKPFWSWNSFFGGNFLGSYSFYTYGSPFFWPLLLFPDKYVAVGMSLMFILKHVVAALTACLYLKKHVKNEQYAVVGGLLYAFSSFTMDSSYYYHFLEVIALFPLLLYAIDEALENRKKLFLAFITMICAVTNYYFFISTSLLVLIYVVFRVKANKEYNYRRVVSGIIYYMLGALAAAVVLLPSVLCLLETSKATGFIDTIFTKLGSFILQIPELIKGIILPSEGVLGSSSGLPMSQFSSNAAFLPLFGALFLFVAFKMKKDEWSFKLVKFLFIISLIPFINGAFSMYSNITYTRWWYGFVLIMILVTLKVVEEGTENHEIMLPKYKSSAKIIAKLAVITYTVYLLAKIITAYLLDDYIMKSIKGQITAAVNRSKMLRPFDTVDLKYFIAFLLMIVVNYGALFLCVKKKWIYSPKRIISVLCVVCIAFYGVYIVNETNGFKSKLDTYVGNDTSLTDRIEYNYRVDSLEQYDHHLDNGDTLGNYAMINNRPAISTKNSFKSFATSQFSRIVGYRIDNDPASFGYYNTSAIQTVLNVAQVRTADGKYVDTEYYVPMGYVYEYYVPDDCEYVADEAVNNARIEKMVYACYLDDATAKQLGEVLEPLGEKEIDWKIYSEELKNTAATEIKMEGNGLTAVTKGEKERLLYFSIPNDNGWEAYINGEKTEIYTINGGMMGIIAPVGESHIEFKFTTPGLKLGMYVSIAAIISLMGIAVVEKIKKRKI